MFAKMVMLVKQLLILGCLVLVACQTDTNSPGQNSGISNGLKTYRHSEDERPTSLDPIKASTIYSNMLAVSVFDTLYSYKYLARPYVLKPNLAQSMPEVSKDGLTYTIRIKPDTKFQDNPAFPNGKGRSVTAQDFVYSILRSFDPKNAATGAWLWQGKILGLSDWSNDGANYDQPPEGLKALDDHTIQITLTQPFPQLTYTLAMGFSGIVPREVVESLGPAFGSQPLGSGPFQLDRFDGSTAFLRKHPNFRQEVLNLTDEGYDPEVHQGLGLEALEGRITPFIDRLEVHFISKDAARWNSFTKGTEIHYTEVPKDRENSVILDKKPLRIHPQITQNYHHSFSLEAGFVYHGFDMSNPDFGNTSDPEHDAKTRNLRCAIRKAHNWDQKNRAFYLGLGEVFPGIIPPSVPEFDPDLSQDSVTLDLSGAKALLAEAGYDSNNLPSLEYHVTGSVLQKQFFEQMRGFLQKIDFSPSKLSYQPYASFGSFNQAVKNRQTPFFFLGWTLDYPDAENTLQLFYGPNQTPGSNNFNYQNPAYDALFEQTQVMLPSPERTALYQQMNQIVIDDCVVISGLSRRRIHLWHKNVITYPDREMVGGFHFRYVDLK